VSQAAKGARRTLIGLAVLFVFIFGLLSTGVLTNNTGWAPGLALDLAGGRQIILEAQAEGETIDQSDLNQAVQIIRNRVDASGTSEAEITTQGDTNILVALPGTPDEATLDLIRQSAQLQFRPVLQVGYSTITLPTADPAATSDPTATPEPTASTDETLTGTSPTPSADAAGDIDTSGVSEVANVVSSATTPSASATPEPSATPEATDTTTGATTAEPTNPSDLAWITPEIQAQFDAINCSDPNNQTGVDPGDPNAAFVTCNQDGVTKYILGPVELAGDDIATATSGPEQNPQTGAATGGFMIMLDLTGDGGNKFYATTQRLAQLTQPQNQFAIILDGVVLSDPRVTNPIPGGSAQITGNFTQASAQALADQLKFGALPLTLEVQSEQNITATKGADELRNGLLAGLIGLILVVIYTMFQYRALGAVTIGSLLVAGGITYGLIALLSWGLGYRLSLAGVTGLIVAIGITADSFIVYFERVKDELREGRSLQAAVEHGWKSARRTILASDAVNFLAALVLYMLAVGGVRGFAFTLGLTTLVDLLVVIMFTHPVLVLLARTKFFGEGHKWSGLDPRQLGRDTMYKGRGRVATPSAAAASDGPLTLAERKAAKARGAVATEDKE